MHSYYILNIKQFMAFIYDLITDLTVSWYALDTYDVSSIMLKYSRE